MAAQEAGLLAEYVSLALWTGVRIEELRVLTGEFPGVVQLEP